MKITVRHSTIYRYEVPVLLTPHLLRLRPRTNDSQRVLDFEIDINPMPLGKAECLDQDGNQAINAWFNATTHELRINTKFVAETLVYNPFAYLLSEEFLLLPMKYAEPLRSALWPYLNSTQVDPSVRRFAESTATDSYWQSLTFLSELNQRVYQRSSQIIRPDGPAWTSDFTLLAGEGACRDLAVLFCDACRVVGLAARFVSGYECVPSRGADAYMHTWAEVYLPGIGWRGYDPSRGLAVSNRHLAVAAGFSPDLAAPVSGWYLGQAKSQIDASLIVEID